MRSGDLVANRFVIERPIGRGGMGSVFRATDRTDGRSVAVKVLEMSSESAVERFRREVRVLAELSHPGIVRYVAHGKTEAEEPFLVMDLLEGQDLASKLAMGQLSIAESVTVIRHAAEVLAFAHGRGILHRDIKPSNLFLVGGQVNRVSVLDFGVARAPLHSSELTRTGTILGTFGYMAPEQATGSRAVDSRADVFALGCVLYECLAGKPAYPGDHVIAILAKILLEDAPAVSLARPDVPPALADLLRRMLSRDAAARPADANAVLTELAAIDDPALPPAPAPPKPPEPPPALTGEERTVLCVLVAVATAASVEATRAAGGVSARRDVLRVAASPFRGKLELLADGSVVVTFATGTDPADLARRAARCALALRPLVDTSPMVLTMGRGEVGETIKVSRVVESALRLLGGGGPPEIRVDDLCAGLLDTAFQLREGRLEGERNTPASERLLLGKPTRCVGRERHLGMLDGTFVQCVEDREPRVVLLTAPAGVGKSRLRHEFLRRHEQEAEVWVGRGDPMRAGAPFDLLSQAIRGAISISGAETLAERQAILRARVLRSFDGENGDRIAEFLGELIDTPFPDANSVLLRAARQEPTLMGDQMLHAWEDWLGAESAAHPIMLVFEDLHWGDLPTVRFVDAALRNLKDRPIFVLAAARLEVHEKFPNLWAERGMTEIRLLPLSRKPCEQLVLEVLGDSVSPEVVARIVDRAEGNAFYLEELIRSVSASSGGDALPTSVILMLQSRLTQLPPDLRLLLRAGSVFGNVFAGEGAGTLLGNAAFESYDDQFRELIDREWLTRDRHSLDRRPVYTFRHDLVREAAYATLTDADKALGHRLAADWLERNGETEAIVIAQHCERAGALARAAGWYRRAVEQAFEGNDLKATIERAERGVACGATGETLGAIRVLQAEAHNWSAQSVEGDLRAREAMKALTPGSALWAHAVHQGSWAALEQGRGERVKELAEALIASAPGVTATRLHVLAYANVSSHLFVCGLVDTASHLVDRCLAATHLAGDPVIAGSMAEVQMLREAPAGNLSASLAFAAKSIEEYERAGDARHVCMMMQNRAYNLLHVGAFAEAEDLYRQVVISAQRLGLPTWRRSSIAMLGFIAAIDGRHDEAVATLRELMESSDVSSAVLIEARAYLSRALHATGNHAGAAEQAARAMDRLNEIAEAGKRGHLLATSAQAQLAIHDLAGAVANARQALDIIDTVPAAREEESFIRLVHAEVMHAAGDLPTARTSIATARDRLAERAARIDSPELRESFLTKVPQNARTLALAGAWGA